MNKFKSLIISIAALLTFGVLAGCTPVIPGNSNASGQEPATSGNESVPTPYDENWVDYTQSAAVRLSLDYQGRDFYQDGIGQVTLLHHIDGDTAHFTPLVTTTSSLTIKSRYYGIDTPESTGRIQPWGQPASDFNKAKLKLANENGTIVISTAQENYGKPQYDSTGERFVSMVWIHESKKNAPFNELYLLNLAIVQEGYSWVKNVQDMPEYADTFYAAEAQAKKYNLRLFSGEPEDGFPTGDYVNTSILELKVETEKYIQDKEYKSSLDGQKVRIRGTVAGYSDGTMYLESYFEESDSEEIRGEGKGVKGGEWASINVFCGMSSVPSKYRKINTFIQLCVFAKNSENFGFQLTGAEGHFPIVESEATDEDCKILIKADDNVGEQQLHYLEYTPSALSTIASNSGFECLNCAVKVTEPVECSRFYINTAGTEITLSFKDCSFSAYITFSYAGDPEKKFEYWNTEEQFLGKKFLLTGIYTYHQTASGKINYQIIFNDASGIQWVKDNA